MTHQQTSHAGWSRFLPPDARSLLEHTDCGRSWQKKQNKKNKPKTKPKENKNKNKKAHISPRAPTGEGRQERCCCCCCCCSLVAYRPSNMQVYLRDGSAQTILRTATLRQKLQTFHLTRSQYTDTGPTSPSTDPITPSAWQGSHWDANFEVTCMSRPRKKSRRKRESNPGSSALEADALITRPTRRCDRRGPAVLALLSTFSLDLYSM